VRFTRQFGCSSTFFRTDPTDFVRHPPLLDAMAASFAARRLASVDVLGLVAGWRVMARHCMPKWPSQGPSFNRGCCYVRRRPSMRSHLIKTLEKADPYFENDSVL
jgi:hypothetical protein